MSTSPLQTALLTALSHLSLFEILCVRGAGMGDTSGAGSRKRRHSQGNQTGARGSHHCWYQLRAECVGKWQIWGVVVGLLLSTQHWFTCCHFFPFRVSLCTARNSCPTHPVAQPQGLQCCFSAWAGHSPWGAGPALPASESGRDTLDRGCQEKTTASSHRASDGQWQTCAVPSCPHLSPPFHTPSKSDGDSPLTPLLQRNYRTSKDVANMPRMCWAGQRVC